MPEPGYVFDVFLSYTRHAGAGRWVKEHFYPALRTALANAMPRTPRIFVDWDIRSGAVWPDNLKFNLQRSKHLVAVLSPPYFRSAWCQAELNTFIRRMQVCHERKPNRRYEITHPVIFADGKHFPPEVAKLQHADFSPWGFDLPYETFSQVPCYYDFLKAVQEFAVTLADRIDDVPDWDPSWPLVEPDPLPEPIADLPGLWEDDTI